MTTKAIKMKVDTTHSKLQCEQVSYFHCCWVFFQVYFVLSICKAMYTFRQTQDLLAVALDAGDISEEEYLLLWEANI